MHSKIDAEGPGPLWAVIGKQAEGVMKPVSFRSLLQFLHTGSCHAFLPWLPCMVDCDLKTKGTLSTLFLVSFSLQHDERGKEPRWGLT